MITPKKELKYLLTLTTIFVISIILIKISFKYLMPMIVSFLIALALNPILVFAKHKLKIKKSITSSLLILIILGLFVLIIGGISSWIWQEISLFMNNLPERVMLLKELIDNYLTELNNLHFIKDKLKLNNIINNFDFSPYITMLSGKIADIGVRIPDIFIKLIFMVLMTFFFMLNTSRIKRYLSSKLPTSYSQNIKNITKQIIGGYVVAQGKLLLMIFVMLLILFIICKVPYALSLAIITAILDCLPVFGTGTILIPYVIIEIIYQDYKMAICLVVIYVTTQTFRRFVEPKILGNSIGLDTFSSIICLFIGYQFFGAIGLILGIPFGVIIKHLYNMGIFNKPISNIIVVKNWIIDIVKN